MARATYLHPEVVHGRANGRFHLIRLDVPRSPHSVGSITRFSGAQGLALALLVSALLWAGIAALVF